MICPCKDCMDRKLGCHGRCEPYQEWKQENDAARAWLREQMPVMSEARTRGWTKWLQRISRGWGKHKDIKEYRGGS